MNPAARPGQPGQAGQTQVSGQPRVQMLRPETIERIAWLSAEDRAKYSQGLRNLWTSLENLPKDSADYASTQQRIINFSRSLIQKNAQHVREAQARKQASASTGQADAAMNDPSNPATVRPAPAAPAGPDDTASSTTAGATAPVSAPAPAPILTGPQPSQGQPQPQVPDHILAHVNKATFMVPPGISSKGPVESKKFIENLTRGFAQALWRMEQSRQAIGRLESIIKERKEKGQSLTAEELKNIQARREAENKKYDDAYKFVNQLQRQQDALKKHKQGQNGAPKPGTPSQPSSQGMLGMSLGGAAATPGGEGQSAQGPAPPVNAAVEPAKNQTQQSGTGAGGQAPQQPGASQGPGSQGKPASGPGTIPSTTHSPTVGAGKSETAHPPPVNTQIASAAAMNQHASTGTPTQSAARVQTPVSAATPVTAGARPLTITNAIAMAGKMPTNASAPMPGQPSNNTPSSAGNGVIGAAPSQATSQQSHAHAHPTQNPASAIPPKMPIPKTLHEPLTKPPAPVSLGTQARPTLTGGTGTPGGALGQPANPRVPGYTHQDEGEHVLSKKKLDDLVRQVCGGTAEGQDSNLLTPEVEENVLLLADTFMDNVLTVACRNAKERGSKVLEIRDIQLVLERVYNIRVPGYSSDELRTVRKVQPNSAWIAKMSAVQAAKVMPGKGD